MISTTPLARAVKRALLTSLSATILTQPVFAEDEVATDDIEKISVTGSRIKKAEFSNAAPVHVIKADDALKVGMRTVSDLLQNTSMANGQQFDSSFNSNSGGSNASEPPPSGGVGSSNVGLRGLGPERTLILINGRRLGASGVRGAPSQPDLSLIPVNMVDRIEVITEGASSIYGADAVAGVINIILKDSYDGLEVSASISDTSAGGGGEKDFSFITGFEGDKAKFAFSASYYERERVAVKDRTDCIKKIFEDRSGNVTSVCSSRFWDNTMLDLSGGVTAGVTDDIAIFYTPGTTDIGVDNFSSALGLPVPGDPNVAITSANQRNRRIFSPLHHDGVDRMEADLVQPVTRYTVAANGSYYPEWWGGDEEIFYEAYYFHRHLTNLGSTEQIFPTIPGMIPQENEQGNLMLDAEGNLDMVQNPLNPFGVDVSNIITLEDLPQERKVELNHFRFVTGMRGEFTSNWMSNNNWTYEMFASYDRGVGEQSQPVMNETNLSLTLGTLRLDSEGNLKCGVTAPAGIGFITPNECVPVDFLAPSIFSGGRYGGGTFATQAEKDFLIGTRLNTTTVEQTMASAFATGEVFDFEDGGAVTVAIGAEFRKDRITSQADMLGATGIIAAENPLTEGPTNGSRTVSDVFGEISMPILVEQDWADLLEVEAALRYTDESNFGSELTNRARVTYKPTEDLLFSTSYGTSFRAPNLREQFLANQFGGVSGSADPCAVPEALQTNSAYDPSKENRSDTVLANCTAQGADFTQIGLSGVPTIPTTSSGNAEGLKPETSENITASFKWTPVFDDGYEFDLGITYWSLEVEDTIRTVSAATILKRCFDAPNMDSPFCPRISRNSGNPAVINFPNLVDTSFLNIGEETSKGVDVNTHFAMELGMLFDAPLKMIWNNQYTLQTERDLTIFKGEKTEDLLEDFGTPEHRLVSSFNFITGGWNLTVMANYMSGTHASDDVIDTANCEEYIVNEELAGKPETVPVCSADSAVYVDSSLTYAADDFAITFGITNVFDTEPELVDISAGSNRGNMVTSSGYDLLGRGYFLNASYRF